MGPKTFVKAAIVGIVLEVIITMEGAEDMGCMTHMGHMGTIITKGTIVVVLEEVSIRLGTKTRASQIKFINKVCLCLSLPLSFGIFQYGSD